MKKNELTKRKGSVQKSIRQGPGSELERIVLGHVRASFG